MSAEKKNANAKEPLVERLRTLHQEYARALRDVCTDEDRKLEDVFRSVTAEMTGIENEATESMRKASEEFRKSDEFTAQGGTPGAAYWDCQKRMSELTADARKRADAARTQYLENWKNVANEFAGVREKAARDFLGKVHEAWRNTDMASEDAATVEALVRSLTAAFAC